MKKAIQYKGDEHILKCVEMSHSSVGGEYEIGLSKKTSFNLDTISRQLAGSAYKTLEMNERSLTLARNGAEITILKKGRILIQDLLPDTFEEAIKIGEDLINAEQANID